MPIKFSVKKKNFNLIYNLSQKYSWLQSKSEALENILFEECENISQTELIVQLLGKFKFLSLDEFNDALCKLVDCIVETPYLSDTSTLLSAISADATPDSGQYILYALKPIFEEKSWRKHLALNRYDQIWRKIQDHHTNIVLVDEFIGSGKTVIGRVKRIIEMLESKKQNNKKIYVFTIASMQEGLDNIMKENLNINIQSIYTLQKGIATTPNKDTHDEVNMLSLESKLSSYYDQTPLPSLGYGESCSLYARKGGNTPNNVFPIFWWPLRHDQSDRPRLLIRAMGDA